MNFHLFQISKVNKFKKSMNLWGIYYFEENHVEILPIYIIIKLFKFFAFNLLIQCFIPIGMCEIQHIFLFVFINHFVRFVLFLWIFYFFENYTIFFQDRKNQHHWVGWRVLYSQIHVLQQKSARHAVIAFQVLV